MTLNEILAMHVDPRKSEHSMIYEVWQDGEITTTKGGDLFRHRNLHVYENATGDDVIDPNLMPERLGKNGSICVLTYSEALVIRDWINAQRIQPKTLPSDDTEGGDHD